MHTVYQTRLVSDGHMVTLPGLVQVTEPTHKPLLFSLEFSPSLLSPYIQSYMGLCHLPTSILWGVFNSRPSLTQEPNNPRLV